MVLLKEAPSLAVRPVTSIFDAFFLEKTGWKIKGVNGATALLGVKPTTLLSRIQKMGLKRPG
jgi:formate hydrogenlyase transcriptional activator